MQLEYAVDGQLARIVAVNRDKTVELLYSEGSRDTNMLRFINSSDGSHISDVDLRWQSTDSQKYILSIEDDDYVRQVMDFAREYMESLARNMGFDFDLNRTPREREQCIESCDKTCSDGSTTYGTVIGIAGLVAPPTAAVGAALLFGVIGLEIACKAKCRDGWRCR